MSNLSEWARPSNIWMDRRIKSFRRSFAKAIVWQEWALPIAKWRSLSPFLAFLVTYTWHSKEGFHWNRGGNKASLIGSAKRGSFFHFLPLTGNLNRPSRLDIPWKALEKAGHLLWTGQNGVGPRPRLATCSKKAHLAPSLSVITPGNRK